MACLIKRNEEGNIVEVLVNSTGQTLQESNLSDTLKDFKAQGIEVNLQETPESYLEKFNNIFKEDRNDKNQLTELSLAEVSSIVNNGGRLITFNEGEAGLYITNDGYIGGLFKSVNSNIKGAANKLLNISLDLGGRYMDAFDTFLTPLYKRNNFYPTVRVPFNEKYFSNIEGTVLETKPDVLFYVPTDFEITTKLEEGNFIEDYDVAYNFNKLSNTRYSTAKDSNNRINNEIQFYVDSLLIRGGELNSDFTTVKGELKEFIISKLSENNTTLDSVFLQGINDYIESQASNFKYSDEVIESIIKEKDSLLDEVRNSMKSKSGEVFNNFFSNITQGLKGVSNVAFSPILDIFKDNYKAFMSNYTKYTGNFDNHIATSIPTHREIQVVKGSILANTKGINSLLDIGGSEGSFSKSVTATSNGRVQTTIVDPQNEMEEFFNSNPVEGSTYVNQPYMIGWEGRDPYTSTEKFDAVHESMVFQFINNNRESHIDYVIKNNLKENGVLFLEEKFKDESDTWYSNEAKKNEYKKKYYSEQELKEKKESVLTGMHVNMIPAKKMEDILSSKFKYVYKYWDAGNFKGYFATNDFGKFTELSRSFSDKGYSEYSDSNVGQFNSERKFSKERVKTGKSFINKDSNLENVEKSLKQRTLVRKKIDTNVMKAIANYHDDVRDNRKGVKINKSYDAFKQDVLKQYNMLLNSGYTIRPYLGKGEPYATSKEMIEDVRNNKNLFYLRTEVAIGQTESEVLDDYTLNERLDFTIDGVDVVYNDLFRAVHDILGHSLEGNSFSSQGELNAFFSHAELFSEEALSALFLETVVYNAWYSYGRHLLNEDGGLNSPNGVYAPRKIYSSLPENMNNIIEEVTQEESKDVPSMLFSQLQSIPHINEKDREVIYKGIYSKAVKDTIGDWENTDSNYLRFETGEPMLVYKVGDTVYTDFQEAFDNSTDRVEIGFLNTEEVNEVFNRLDYDNASEAVVKFKDSFKLNDNSKFVESFNISTLSDNSLSGFLNESIRQGYINAQMTEVNGEFKLKGRGNLQSTSTLNARLFEDNNTSNDYSVSSNENGDVEVSKIDKKDYNRIKETILKGDFNKLKGNNPLGDVLELAVREGIFESKKLPQRLSNKSIEKTDEQIKLQLLDTLNKLGFSVTSISDYLNNYSNRNGVDISVEALADMTNKIVALAEGKDTAENISEEVAHILIEGFENQELVDKVLKEVESTDLWAEFSKIYYDKYSEQYEGAELDNVVRREILGKLLSRTLLNRYKVNSNEVVPEGLLGSLRQLVTSFLNKIKQLFNPLFKSDLNNLLDLIAEKTINEQFQEIIDPSNFDNNKYTFFSLSDKKDIVQLVKARQVLDKRVKRLKTANSSLGIEAQQDLSKISEVVDIVNNEMRVLDDYYAVKVLLASVGSQVHLYNRKVDAVRNGEDEFTPLDKEEIFSLVNEFGVIIKELRPLIVKDFEDNEFFSKQKIVNEIDTYISEIAKIEGEIPAIHAELVDSLVEKTMQRYMIPEDQREALREMMDSNLKDVSWVFRTFGSLEHSSNKYLGILHRTILDNLNRAHNNTLTNLKDFWKEVETKGFTKAKFSTLIKKNPEGKNTRYTVAPYDFSLFETDKKQAQVDAYNKVFNTNLSVDEFDRGRKEGNIKRNTTNELLWKDYLDEFSKWIDNNTEKKYINEFYDLRKDMYSKLGISESTQEFLRNLSIQRSEINSKYRDSEGNIDHAQKTQSDLIAEANLVLQRKSAKNEVDLDTGELKVGESLTKAKELQKLDDFFRLTLGGDNTSLSEYNSKYDLDLDSNFVAKYKKDFKLKDDFNSIISQIEQNEGSEKAFQWLMLNGGISLNDTFWSNLSTGGGSFVEKLEEALEILEDESGTLELKLGRIKELVNRKVNILKQYQQANNPAEVQYDLMSESSKQVLKEVEEELYQLFLSFNSVIGEDLNEEEADVVSTESNVNEAYTKALKDSNDSEFDFILKHVTDRNKSKIFDFKNRLEKIQEGSEYVDRAYKRFIERRYGVEPTATNIADLISKYGVEEISLDYGKSKLLPYFKRFAPSGYTQFISDLKSGKESVVDLINGNSTNPVAKYVDVSPKFSWNEDLTSNKYLNPNYIESFEGGYMQPSNKYLDDSFFDKYNISKSEFLSSGNLNATDNIEEYSMLERLWDIKRKALEAYGESYRGNIYKLPQVSAKQVERTENFVRKNPINTFKNTVRDLVYNRRDDQDYGAQVQDVDVSDFSDIRLVPKYFIRDLEEVDDISTELAYSYSELLSSAYVFKERVGSLNDIMIAEQGILNTQFKSGKNARDTNTYKMFKEHSDAYLFGIRRNRKTEIALPNGKKLDISKIVTGFDNFVRAVNIGFSPFIAATGLTTGVVFKRIEGYIGEHVHNGSINWAHKELVKLTPQFANDIGKISKSSKLYLLGEKYRLNNISDRTLSSGYNRIIRSLNNLPYKIHEIADYPITQPTLLSLLDDFRYVGDKFIDYNRFKRLPENLELSNKEARLKWDTFRDQSLYNNLEVKEGIMEFSDFVKEQYKGREKELEEFDSFVQSKVSRVVGNLISVVPQDDKSAATRDFLARLATAHRGWLSIGVQRKFKRKHFNWSTGQTEEGHYVTLKNYLLQVSQGLDEKSVKGLMKSIRENWELLDDFEKRNLKRILVDFASYHLLLAMGLLVAGMIDDEDNKDNGALQFMAYIYFRTVSEVGSVQLPTGAYGMIDTVQAPFIAINSIKQLADVKGWSLDEVSGSSPYEGHSKLYKTIMNQTWARHYYGLKDVQRKSDFYRLNNSETLLYLAK